MSDYNLFPDFPKWFWVLLVVIFVIGVAAIVGGLGYGAYQLFKHLQWQ